MKISVITVVYNSEKTIACAIESVASQSYQNVEHIVIDGGSTDGTLGIVSNYSDRLSFVVSEPDGGIYDAMNKGLNLATGDVIGTLNADDLYFDSECLKRVANEFKNKNVESVFADLVFVNPDNLDRIVRYYSSEKFCLGQFAYGWMPAHPTFFVRKDCYRMYGNYKTDYKIAADFELLVRFLLSNRITYSHIKNVIVKMRTGGVSTKNLMSNWILNQEIVRACRENDVDTNILKVMSKYFRKSLQLFQRPQ